MRYEIMQPGAFAFLKVQLEAGESIKAESDAMMAMSGNIKVEGKMEGGMLGEERQKTAYHELLARLWASIHLIQSVRMGKPDEGLEQARREVGHYTADAPNAQDLH